MYAFSLDNFRRSSEEVNALMKLCGEKLRGMCERDSLIQRYGMRVRVVGDLRRLSAELREDIARAEQMTAHNSSATLTVCFAYTSRYEIAEAMRKLASRCVEGSLRPELVSDELLEAEMMTSDPRIAPVDLLLRTSGEKRLSDFLLWQSATCVVIFSKVRWPDLSLLRFLGHLVAFQRAQPALAQMLRARTEARREPPSWAPKLRVGGAAVGGLRAELVPRCGQRWLVAVLAALAALCAVRAVFAQPTERPCLGAACVGTGLAWTLLAFAAPPPKALSEPRKRALDAPQVGANAFGAHGSAALALATCTVTATITIALAAAAGTMLALGAALDAMPSAIARDSGSSHVDASLTESLVKL